MKKVFLGALLAAVLFAGAGWITMQNADYWFPGTVSVQKELDIKEASGLKLAGVAVTAGAAELNILDGCTATYDQLNAAASGNIALARLTNVLQVTGAGVALAAFNANALTNVNAANLAGTLSAVNGAAVTALSAANITAGGTITAINGNAITNLNAANLAGTLPAIDGSALTGIQALTTNTLGATAITITDGATFTNVLYFSAYGALTNATANP